MLKNFFKNFVKSTLVIFLALTLSNFLPALIQSAQNPANPNIQTHHSTQNVDGFVFEAHADNNEPNNDPNNTNNQVQPSVGSVNILPTGLDEVKEALQKGNLVQALNLIKQKIQELIPISNFLKVISYPLFIVIGALLDNQIFASPVMKEVLGDVWSQVRNLCYFILVIYALFIAVYNVFSGSSDSQYSLKKGFQEIIIAMFLINISWTGAMIVLDVSNVAINVTYSWATQYQNTQPQNIESYETAAKICKSGTKIDSQPICQAESKEFKALSNFLGRIDQRSLPMNLAIRFGRVLEVDKIDPSTIDKNTDAITLVGVYLVKLFIFIVQFFSYLMLAYFLIIRIIYIWIYIALSPLIVLDKVMSGLSLDASEHFQKFFNYALIAPIKGGIGFTFAYIILDSISRTPTTFSSSEVLNSVALSIGALDSFQSLLVYFASVAVIYEITLTMADNTAASNVFTWLRSKVEGTGKLISSAAANTGVFLGAKKSNAKSFAESFFPNSSVLNSSNEQEERQERNSNNTIKSSDTAQVIVRKFQARTQPLKLYAINKILADPSSISRTRLTPQIIINNAADRKARERANAIFSHVRTTNRNKTFNGNNAILPKEPNNPA